MMKLQDVLLKAMAKRISWADAAEIIGVTDRTMRRWRERLEQHGYNGLTDRRKGKPSRQRVPLATAEEVLELYQKTYYDLNVRHFHEKLKEEHGIQLSYTWVQQALQGAGLVKKGRKRGVHRQRRPRRPPGRRARRPGGGTVNAGTLPAGQLADRLPRRAVTARRPQGAHWHRAGARPRSPRLAERKHLGCRRRGGELVRPRSGGGLPGHSPRHPPGP